MQRNRFAPAAVLVGLATIGFLAWSAGARNATGPARSAVTATVDIQKLINSLDELTSKQKDFDKFRDDLKAKIEAKKKTLDDAEAALKVLPDGGPEQRTKAEEFRRLTLELEFEGKFAAGLIDEKRGTIYASIYRKIAEASGRFAKQNGYDVILADDSKGPIPEVGSEQTIRAFIVSRQVVFAADAVDVTNDLLVQMNNEFKAGANGK